MNKLKKKKRKFPYIKRKDRGFDSLIQVSSKRWVRTSTGTSDKELATYMLTWWCSKCKRYLVDWPRGGGVTPACRYCNTAHWQSLSGRGSRVKDWEYR